MQCACICLICTIQHPLSIDSTKTHLAAFVLSRLDYCNSLLSGCPEQLLEKLQKVQNAAARLILKAHKPDHVSPRHKTLHWLSIQACIKYKLSTFCHFFFLLFMCRTFFMSTLHQDSSTPLLTQKLYMFCTYRPKHLEIKIFLSHVFCLEFSAS